MRLTEDELVLYQEWIENNRLEPIVREMRGLSSRVLALITRPGGPMRPPRLGLVVGGGPLHAKPALNATARPG